MKVLLIGNYVPDGQTSMLAFRRVLERELPRLGCELRVISPPRRIQRVPSTSKLWKWLGYLDKFVLFLPELASAVRWADVVHIGDHSNAMYVPRVRSKPNVITCHDVIAVQAAMGMIDGWRVGWTGRLFQRLISKGLGQADLVACVSDLTRRELLKLRLAPPERVTTVMNGLNDNFRPVPPDESARLLSRFGLQPGERFLVHVGWDLDRKNRRKVLATFIALQQRARERGVPAPVDRLVFVGPELVPDMAQMAQQAGLADRVHAIQNLSHDELCAVYSSATALLFPSLQEGFGWPVIEAQACGCPVFTSDLAPMNEIGGPGASYVDPNDAQAMAQAIERESARFAEMRSLGLDNASHYTAEQMTRHYIEAYRRVIEERKARA